VSQVVRINFFGNVYELKSDDPDVDLKELVSYIEDKIAEIEKAQPSLPPNKLMVLVAMSLGRDFFAAKRQLDVMREGFSQQAKRLVAKIDSSLDEKI